MQAEKVNKLISLDNKTFSEILQDLCSIFNYGLFFITHKSAFETMCFALYIETEEIINYFKDKSEQYKKRLPLFDELPRDFDVNEGFDSLDVVLTKLSSHPFYRETKAVDVESNIVAPGDLLIKINQLKDEIENIFNLLNPLDCPELYVQYAKDELETYSNGLWNKQLRSFRIEESTSVNTKNYYNNELNRLIKELKTFDIVLIGNDDKILYREALGQLLWMYSREVGATKDELHVILSVVKSIEYFSRKAGDPIIWVDRDVENNTNMNSDESEEQKQIIQIATLKEVFVPWCVLRINKLNFNYENGCSDKWIGSMLDKLFDEKEIVLNNSKKFSPIGRTKTLMQIIGELMLVRQVINYNGNRNAADVTESFKKLFRATQEKDSLSNYVRLQINDSPDLKEYIDNYPLESIE